MGVGTKQAMAYCDVKGGLFWFDIDIDLSNISKKKKKNTYWIV